MINKSHEIVGSLWIAIDPNGWPCLHSLTYNEEVTIRQAMKYTPPGTWQDAKALGWCIIKVKLEEVT